MGEYTGFGWVRIFGKTYNYDIVICKGKVLARRKNLSRAYRERYGHTPLSELELDEYLKECGKPEIIVIGTGVYGALPLTPEAKELLNKLTNMGIKVVIEKTNDTLIKIIENLKDRKILVVIHTTC